MAIEACPSWKRSWTEAISHLHQKVGQKMKYEKPKFRSDEEILVILSREGTSTNDRIEAVLSALYYGSSIQFSGDILIEEFSNAKYPERIYLKNLFETYYGMCATDYRIEDSIKLLKEYIHENPIDKDAIETTIEAILEYKVMYASGP
ncbi:hypothetical protein [Alterisphingorhabdus coralli]|uniref:Uncharacterized protein n=1 Tax=Alterisphingorhabdus coralli TaxID=3071408 RepID=A0AA97F5S4_9SPHN|nr:hypothetical protein [Parasphingorhabdus sp. SCSIO 66989]WOE74473.1 hypothetical protein RB602_11520 [Parasphingorhabdus sp. SCSIO 66989]